MAMQLDLPYSAQGKKSGNCGPCSIKMLADYYQVKKHNGQSYSVQSLNRLCRVSKEWGCEKSDMARVLKRLGLKRQKVRPADFSKTLKKGQPILTLFIDETGGGHYAVIKGQDRRQLVFNDPYFGENTTRKKRAFVKQAKRFGQWHWAIGPV